MTAAPRTHQARDWRWKQNIGHCSSLEASAPILTYIRAGLGQCAASCCDLPIEQLPDVDHVGPDLQSHPNVSRTRRAGEPYRIVEQCFGGADLDQHGWQPLQIRI